MTLERKKNITPRRQARTNSNNNNNNNNSTSNVTCGSTLSYSLPANPAAGLHSGLPVNNNISCIDVGIKSGKCYLSSAPADDIDDRSHEPPINSRNTPSAINILTSSSGSSTADHFANR